MLSFDELSSRITNFWPDVKPGQDVQYRMAPQNRPRPSFDWIESQNPKKSAVLILIYPIENDIPCILLMQRPSFEKGAHAGQISFPGGKHEPFDEDLKQTALREFMEETGTDSSLIQIVGELSELYIPVSNLKVSPFVGITKKRPPFLPNAEEIERLIEVNLHYFLDIENQQNAEINVRGKIINAPAYILNDDVIWGATAMIISEFTAILKSI